MSSKRVYGTKPSLKLESLADRDIKMITRWKYFRDSDRNSGKVHAVMLLVNGDQEYLQQQ